MKILQITVFYVLVFFFWLTYANKVLWFLVFYMGQTSPYKKYKTIRDEKARMEFI